MKCLLKIFDNLESYLCRALLVAFVTILFLQILSRELFGHSITWSEELSVYMFVWFVFLGASYAAKLSAHNRVTFHYKWMPQKVSTALELLSDLSWIGFNSYFIYLSYDFVFNRMNLFWKSQTLGIPMKYIYLILPIAFTLMTLRIIQVNYIKYVKGVEIIDPEAKEMNELMQASQANGDETTTAQEASK
ncbi:TRAP transporter small permease [Marinomonas sp. A79]|uniref:TRAP transporter small permease protein n=1 Tax=Marinomonas vulgaris TaxID=2823372 RepID=A0ABS5HG21_9GAMM|nr:TRAP transporter small permease [Marinomonas vulgaris]MBR7890317.1 TRAP transporter small permease [Marinomonas vulgaris]